MMRHFQPIVRHTILGAFVLVFSITSASAAIVWDNGETNLEGAWWAAGTLEDDFDLGSSAIQVGSVNAWMVTTAPPSFDNVTVSIDGVLQNQAGPVTILENLGAVDTSGWLTDPGGVDWSAFNGALFNYKINIDLVNFALAGAHTLQIGLNPISLTGWMWSSETEGQSIDATPTNNFLGDPGTSTHPPDDLAFQIVDAAGNVAPLATPVPAAIWLFGTALIGFVGMSRRTNLS